MKNKKKSRSGNGFIWIGVLLILGALCLTAYNRWDAARAARAAQEVLTQLNEQLPERKTAHLNEGPVPEMPTIEIDGNLYIGTIAVPALEIELPVMADWDMDKLKISPCRYSGSYYTDDLVIAGHNYGRHFSPLKWSELNTDVYFTNVEGIVYHYVIDNKESLNPEDVEEMTTGDWDLTLFTCNTGGQTRCTVRCVKAAA